MMSEARGGISLQNGKSDARGARSYRTCVLENIIPAHIMRQESRLLIEISLAPHARFCGIMTVPALRYWVLSNCG